MGKALKKFMEDGKVKKTKQFAHLAKISQGLQKSKNLISQGVRKFSNPAKTNQHTLQKFRKACEKLANLKLPCENLCEIKKGVRTQFATLKSILQVCEDSKSPFENKRSLKSLFKDLQTLLSVCTPHSPLQNPPPHCETLHHLATTNHSKRRPTPLTPFRTWHALEEAIPTLHFLVS